jgi:hypothetical protein
MDPNLFQNNFFELQNGGVVIQQSLKIGSVPTLQGVEAAFTAARFYCLASGESDTDLKFYLYAKDVLHTHDLFAHTLRALECNKRSHIRRIEIRCADTASCCHIEGRKCCNLPTSYQIHRGYLAELGIPLKLHVAKLIYDKMPLKPTSIPDRPTASQCLSAKP